MGFSADSDCHDGVINSIEVDISKMVVRINADVYHEPSDRVRRNVNFEFSAVSRFSSSLSLNDIASNKTAGNINYWNANPSGVTYLYLVNGIIEIDAEALKIETNEAT